ncbi:MAG: hypothetical protein KDC36_11605 [Thermoleophilia bacterium]|nr:hypothetical protein [Thermoleophilia bacterium]
MPHRAKRLVLATAAATLLTATAAAAAPVATTQPKILGKPIVMKTIGCDPGTWKDAVSVTRIWKYGLLGRKTTTASRFRILPAFADNPITCWVTATDAAGATTVAVAQAFPEAAPMKLRFRLTSPARGRIRLVGTAGPKAAFRVKGRRARILLLHTDYALGRQVLITKPVPSSGRFVFNTTDLPGRRRYTVVLQTANSDAFDGISRVTALSVKR